MTLRERVAKQFIESLKDAPRIDMELAAMRVAVAGTQRVTDDQVPRPMALIEYNGKVN